MKSLKVGDVLPYVTTINNQDVYYNSDSEGIAINEKTGVAGYYTPAGIIRIPSSKPQIEYKFTTITKRTEAGFKRQFIYNGKSGSTIKFTYREFNGDMARPA